MDRSFRRMALNHIDKSSYRLQECPTEYRLECQSAPDVEIGEQWNVDVIDRHLATCELFGDFVCPDYCSNRVLDIGMVFPALLGIDGTKGDAYLGRDAIFRLKPPVKPAFGPYWTYPTFLSSATLIPTMGFSENCPASFWAVAAIALSDNVIKRNAI